MEIFELKYFLAAAETQNIHRASEKIHVSPPSISKAISRLESELGIALFERQGRNIRITSHGRLLQERASQLIQLEESARLEIGTHEGKLQVTIAGNEALLSNFGFQLSRQIRELFPQAGISLLDSFDPDTIKKVDSGEAQVGIITSEVPPGVYKKKIGEATFQTVVGPGHKLYKKASRGEAIPVEKVLTYAFASPHRAILGKVAAKQSLDGWRDDEFPRKIDWSTSSLATLMSLVDQGSAIAYLPDYLVNTKNWKVLNVTGCPHSCRQKVHLIARNIDDLSWLRKVLRKYEK